jgi:glycosyltransferase involved in cell wall biosynthesis
MRKKNILFITPVLPSLQQRGRNFRAYQWVSHLQKNYRVSVLCTSVYGFESLSEDVNAENLDCKIFISKNTYTTFNRINNVLSFKPSTWNESGNAIEEEFKWSDIPRPDIILCFRIQNASTALYLSRLLKPRELWLDIDEVDSKVKLSIAKRMKVEGYYLKAIKEYVESTFYSLQESRLISEFDTVFASTDEEQEHLKNYNFEINSKVFCNKLPVFKKNVETVAHPDQASFNFMFVGDSNYFPNLDAINFLLFEILPGLKNVATKPFQFTIVGGAIEEKQYHEIKNNDRVAFYQDVDDLNEIYTQADAVIVPLRVGGGSSLKFLEALRYKKPIVATPVGSRGFNVSNGVQALIGEDSDSIIEHCLKLMSDKELARNLAKKGHQWFLENHSFDVELVKDLEMV